MTFKASENLAEQVADFIGNKIIRFELKQGERIIEEKLAHELGVSRSPIREALRILEKTWLVELIPRKEARVSVITKDMIVSPGEILKELYGLAARRAVELGTPEEYHNISKALKACKALAEMDDRMGYFDAVIKLENACLEATKNEVLNSLLSDLWPYSRRIQFATMQLRTESLNEHFNLFREANEHLVNGNRDRAVATMKKIAGEEIRLGLKYLPQFNKL